MHSNSAWTFGLRAKAMLFKANSCALESYIPVQMYPYPYAKTNMLHFQHSKICQNLLMLISAALTYIETLDGFDCENEF